jgi:antirestriction protein ArdC
VLILRGSVFEYGLSGQGWLTFRQILGLGGAFASASLATFSAPFAHRQATLSLALTIGSHFVLSLQLADQHLVASVNEEVRLIRE